MKFNLKKIITVASIALFAIISFAVLTLNLKVHPQGVPYYDVSRDRQVGGAFESSGSTSRYALTEAIVKQGRMDFDKVEARFAAPDVASANGKYFSLFAPGISFLAIPFYSFGAQTGHEQFFTYFLNVVFAVLDGLLIIFILKKLGYSKLLQITSAFIFIFGTSAFSYSIYLTQHIVSTFFVLLSIYLTMFQPSILTNVLLGVAFGVGLLVDIPNVFLILPPVIYYFFKNFDIKKIKDSYQIKLRSVVAFMLIGVIPFIVIFGWYNKTLAGSPTVIAQFVGRVQDVDSTQRLDKKEVEKKIAEEAVAKKYGYTSPFQTRFLLNGLYILLVSDERGWVYYSPILLVGIVGIYLLYKKENSQDLLLVPVSIILMNILMYGMFGDPWGGWSFGPRYLIPSAAIMVLFIPEVLEKFKKNIFVTIFVSSLIVYSVFTNALGAITTTEIPPKQEAIHLTTQIPYTYEYNFNRIDAGESLSLIYTVIFPDIDPKTIWMYESILLSIVIVTPLVIYSTKEVVTGFKKK